jgi:hypothetical protein
MNSIIDKARAFIANHTAEPRYGAMDEMVKGLIEHIDEQAALSRAKDAAMEVVKDRAETWARTASEVMGERDEALAMVDAAMREGLSECARLRGVVAAVKAVVSLSDSASQGWTPATVCEACKGDEVTGCICGMVPGTEPRKHPTEPTREEKQGKRCECFYSTVAINDIRQCVNCGGTR